MLRLPLPQKIALAVFALSLISLPIIVLSAQTPKQTTSQAKSAPLKWQLSSSAPQTILQVDLNYKEATKKLTLKKLTLKKGFAPTYPPVENGYTAALLDKSGKTLIKIPFTIENVIYDPPPLEGEPPGGPLVIADYNFSLTLPWNQAAKNLQLRTPKNALITTKSTTNLPAPTNRPQFFTTSSVESTPAAILDITFIGDNYNASQLPVFHQDIDRFIALMYTYEPFISRASQINFHYVDDTTDLGCHHDYLTTRLIICENTLVYGQLNNAGVPYDKAYVIFNDPEYGGSGGEIAVGYNGSWGSQTFVHEEGHSLGKLLDEYLLYGSNGIFDSTVKENCYAGNPPAAAWEGLVNLSDYYLECNRPNWYRSSENSVMRRLDSYTFNPVSQRLLNARIDSYVYPTDTAPPQVNITNPTSGASSIQGTIKVTTTATDESAMIKRVDLYLDNQLIYRDIYLPYNFYWNTALVANGPHTLSAKAYDQGDNEGVASVSVTINNPPLPSPPPTPTNFNKAIKFHGSSSEYVLLPFALGSEPFTIEFWAKYDTLVSYRYLLSQLIPTGYPIYNRVSISIKNSNIPPTTEVLAFSLSNGNMDQTVTSNIHLETGKWYHVAAVYTQDSARLYINGQGSFIPNPSYEPINSVFGLGGIFEEKTDGTLATQNTFTGVIDDLKISHGAKYTTDFTPPTTPTSIDSDTLALYRFDGNAKDVIGLYSGLIGGNVEFVDSIVIPIPSPSPHLCPRVYCPDGGTQQLINGKCGCPPANPVE